MRCTLFSVLMTVVTVHAHMEISWPPAFRSKFNPQSPLATVDYSMTNPLNKDGSNYPCKGYHIDMKGATGATKWNAGSKYNYTVVGGADHNGGSCQASLSYDNGNTFKVIHSYIGSCPLPNTGNFEFTVPSDATPGNAIFAWTWLNKVGNREFYMNCAAVNIAPATGESAAPPKVPFSSRPDIFLANLGNGCEAIEGKDAVYPDPGPDVTGMTMGVESSSTLKGQCSQVKPIIPSQKINPHPLPNSTHTSGQIPLATATAPSTTGTAGPKTSGAPSHGMKVSSNGECGGQQTCSGSIYGHCCSKFGYCGDSRAHCGTGCDQGFGECGMNVPSKHIRIRGTQFL